MHINQWQSYLPVLGHADHGIIDGGIAMRMIITNDKTDRFGRFAVGMIPRIAVMIHGIQDSSLYRLESVTGIRQSSFLNDCLGISAEAA